MAAHNKKWLMKTKISARQGIPHDCVPDDSGYLCLALSFGIWSKALTALNYESSKFSKIKLP